MADATATPRPRRRILRMRRMGQPSRIRRWGRYIKRAALATLGWFGLRNTRLGRWVTRVGRAGMRRGGTATRKAWRFSSAKIGVAGGFAMRQLRRIPTGTRRVLAMPVKWVSTAGLGTLIGVAFVVGLLAIGTFWLVDNYQDYVHDPVSAWGAAPPVQQDDEVIDYTGDVTSEPVVEVVDEDLPYEGAIVKEIDGEKCTHVASVGWVPTRFQFNPELTTTDDVIETDKRGRKVVFKGDEGFGYVEFGKPGTKQTPMVYFQQYTETEPVTKTDGTQVKAETIGLDEWPEVFQVKDMQGLYDLIMKDPGKATLLLERVDPERQVIALNGVVNLLAITGEDNKLISEWFGRMKCLERLLEAPKSFYTEDARQPYGLENHKYMNQRDQGDYRFVWFRSPAFKDGWMAEHKRLRDIHSTTRV